MTMKPGEYTNLIEMSKRVLDRAGRVSTIAAHLSPECLEWVKAVREGMREALVRPVPGAAQQRVVGVWPRNDGMTLSRWEFKRGDPSTAVQIFLDLDGVEALETAYRASLR